MHRAREGFLRRPFIKISACIILDSAGKNMHAFIVLLTIQFGVGQLARGV